jgi:signal transduction histidine kinase
MSGLARSAAYRIAFAYSAAFACAMVFLGLILFLAMHIAFSRQLDAIMIDETSELQSEFRGEGPGELVEEIARRESFHDRDRLFYAAYDPGGRHILGTLDAPRPQPGFQALTFRDPRVGTVSGRALVTDIGGGVRLVVATDGARVKAIDKTVVSAFLAGIGAVIAIGIAGALLLGGWLRRRLGRISGAAEAIVAGDLRSRVPVGASGDEFDRVAISLNLMLDRIDGLIGNLRQVSSDVAHDLRTPLARLRNQLESGLHALGDSAAAREVIEASILRVDEVLDLFAGILRIAEVESGGIRDSFLPVDLSAVANELAESYAPAARDVGRALECLIAPGLYVRGDRGLLAQAIVNLLDNALTHTPRGAQIRMTLARAGGGIRFAVADDGPGVPEADRERIVRRFVRLERSRTTPGHGLGLNLVAAVARLHRARLAFGDNEPGLVVSLDFPEALS